MATIETDNTITYTPNPNYHGADAFSYTLSDGMFSDEGTVSVTIRSVNDPLEFRAATTERPVSENAEPGANVGAPVTATDVDADTLAYRLTCARNGSISDYTSDGVRARERLTTTHH